MTVPYLERRLYCGHPKSDALKTIWPAVGWNLTATVEFQSESEDI